ncbi:MAG: amidase [Candidatus Hydrogenedens sp.]|nr:amidase [Candidatus Hydrogenedens sp.]
MPTNSAIVYADDALGTHDAIGVAERIRTKEVSAKEVVEAAIDRCRAVEPQIAAVVEADFERALKRAEAAPPDSPGAFHGVPTFIKDLVAAEGIPTRFGSRAFDRAEPAKKNAPIVAQMMDMGFINLGTSTLPEFGFTPSTEFPDGPPTRNPWNLDHTAGGSSGGAAALVAAGVVPLAHGADGGGSIRIPAACCGLVGHKCSRGRLLQETVVRMMPVNIVVEGALTRSVRDTAHYFYESEKRYHNSKLPRMGLVDRPLERPLRIGMLLESPVGAEVDEATQRTFHETVALLTSLGHEVIPAAIPADEQFKEDFCHLYATGGFIVDRIGRFAFGPNYDAAALTDLTKGLSRAFSARPGRTLGAMRRLRRSAADYAILFQDIDVMLSPVVSKLAPPIGVLGMDLPYEVLFPRVIDWACYTPYCNATGGPSISLPLGRDVATNLPVGMLFSAAHGQDKLLLELALQLEEAKPWPMQ